MEVGNHLTLPYRYDSVAAARILSSLPDGCQYKKGPTCRVMSQQAGPSQMIHRHCICWESRRQAGWDSPFPGGRPVFRGILANCCNSSAGMIHWPPTFCPNRPSLQNWWIRARLRSSWSAASFASSSCRVDISIPNSLRFFVLFVKMKPATAVYTVFADRPGPCGTRPPPLAFKEAPQARPAPGVKS